VAAALLVGGSGRFERATAAEVAATVWGLVLILGRMNGIGEGRSGGDALLLRYVNTDASAFYPWNVD
jgi:hypothetical protein